MTVQKLFNAAPEITGELNARWQARVTLGNEAFSEGRYDEAKRHWEVGEGYLRRAHDLIRAERAQVAA